ncbi:MAG: tetratricopeptide repeat protein [Chloroflexota bacterium]
MNTTRSRSRDSENVDLGTAIQRLQQGKPEEAVDILTQLNSVSPGDIDVLVTLGGILIMLERYEEAVVFLEEAVEIDELHSKAWINMGAAILGNRETASPENQIKAINAFMRAIELDPSAPSVNYNIGLIHLDRGQLGFALEHFERAKAVEPRDRDASKYIERIKSMLYSSKQEYEQ